jgi:hypothetical protein
MQNIVLNNSLLFILCRYRSNVNSLPTVFRTSLYYRHKPCEFFPSDNVCPCPWSFLFCLFVCFVVILIFSEITVLIKLNLPGMDHEGFLSKSHLTALSSCQSLVLLIKNRNILLYFYLLYWKELTFDLYLHNINNNELFNTIFCTRTRTDVIWWKKLTWLMSIV